MASRRKIVDFSFLDNKEKYIHLVFKQMYYMFCQVFYIIPEYVDDINFVNMISETFRHNFAIWFMGSFNLKQWLIRENVMYDTVSSIGL